MVDFGPLSGLPTPSGLRPTRRHLRIAVACCLAITLLALAQSWLTYGAAATSGGNGLDRPLVVTIDGTGPGQIVSYGPDGGVQYRNESLWLYHDVDPVADQADAVSYVASEVVNATHPRCERGKCMRNVVERVNLTTETVTEQAVFYEPLGGSTQIHDVDWVNDSVLLVADISFPDRVFMYDVTTDEVVWEWRVSEAFDKSSGGDYPRDWTHVNDVEVLADGRVMVNLRNQDQVLFLDPGHGIQRNWTLGSDDDHTTLYEPHNPDYIPAWRGGPAILIADSENNRVVEYQRTNGSWSQSWVWADTRLQWPRDADRLPNGQTLIVDSHGSRLLVVGRNGSVAWSHPFPDGGYDAEVLGTGDESTGPSARRANLTAQPRTAAGITPVAMLVSVAPSLVLHGVLFALPIWADSVDAVLIILSGIGVLAVLVVEIAAFGYRRARES